MTDPEKAETHDPRDFKIAWEYGLDLAPKEMWRVVSIRSCGRFSQSFREWFSSEAEMKKRVEWLRDENQQLVSVHKYVLEEP